MFAQMRALAAAGVAAFLIPMAASAAAISFPAGAHIYGQLQQELTSKGAYDGQRFTVVTDQGSVIYGHLSDVVRSSLSHKAHLTLNFDSIRFPDGSTAPLSAKLTDIQQKKSYNIAQIAGALVVGNIAGNYLGHAIGVKGIGGLAGLVGGAIYANNTATDIIVPKNSTIGIQLTQPLVSRRQARQ